MPLLKVGLTGGIASGKSLASQYFSQSGVNIIDADKISKQLLSADSPLLKPIKLRFGENILDVYGQLKRDVLRQIVFNSKEDLDWLNQLIHPKVAETIEQKLSHYNKKADKGYIIIDIPLLINQTGNIPEHLSRFIDRILVIDTDVDNQINRICHRDKLSREDALKIINAQSSREQRLSLADDIVQNNGSPAELESKINILHNKYLKLASKSEK